jgi:hypothetical protein
LGRTGERRHPDTDGLFVVRADDDRVAGAFAVAGTRSEPTTVARFLPEPTTAN